MVEQLIAMEEYEVTLFSEKIASKFSPTGRAPTYWKLDYIKVFYLSSFFDRLQSRELLDFL